MERCRLQVDAHGVQFVLTENGYQEVLHELEVAHIRHLFFGLLVLSLRIEQDGKNFPNIPQEIFIDTLISNDVGLEFLELELLGILVEDGLGGARLASHGQGQGVELHVLHGLLELGLVFWNFGGLRRWLCLQEGLHL